VYGSIGVLENFITFILYWIPFFYPLKLSFILWCYLPQFRGAEVIYRAALLPLFKKHEQDIDAALKKVSGKKSS
jgi:receptor expression-enhancing protein 5/6